VDLRLSRLARAFGLAASCVLLTAVGATGSRATSTAPVPNFSVAQLTAPAGANWILENGNIQSWRYSTLSQINRSDGNDLKLAWTTHLANPTSADELASANANPIVYDGVMYVQDAWTRITALDASTGRALWQFDPRIGLNTGGGFDMRSVGMGDGMIFTGMYGTVYALNAQTGAQEWATQILDPIGGGTIDVSPVYYKGLVIIGTSGGDTGGACEAVALDAKTGKVRWHYSSIPSNPRAFGWSTWPAKRWFYGGGAIWDMPSVDPSLGLVYFGVGQPLPFNGLINGPGEELGTDGVYALNALTGKFAWFFQEVHHDIWDYDGMQTPIVETITQHGKQVNVVDHINKDAYNYVLDATTGKPLISVVERPVPQNALDHTYPTQPIPLGDQLVPHVPPDPQAYQGIVAPDGQPYAIATQPFTPYTDQQYVVIAPTNDGGVEWPDPSWDPETALEYVCANVQEAGFESPPPADQHPVINHAIAMTQLRNSTAPNSLSIARLVAFDPATNKIAWEHDEVSTDGIGAGNATPCASPVTTTASGLALIGRVVATPQYPDGVGMIQAYDAKTGSLDWQIPVLVDGQGIPAVPRITPYSISGREYVVSFTDFSTAGPDISAFTLP